MKIETVTTVTITDASGNKLENGMDIRVVFRNDKRTDAIGVFNGLAPKDSIILTCGDREFILRNKSIKEIYAVNINR